jgi:hypothetical protein
MITFSHQAPQKTVRVDACRYTCVCDIQLKRTCFCKCLLVEQCRYPHLQAGIMAQAAQRAAQEFTLTALYACMASIAPLVCASTLTLHRIFINFQILHCSARSVMCGAVTHPQTTVTRFETKNNMLLFESHLVHCLHMVGQVGR